MRQLEDTRRQLNQAHEVHSNTETQLSNAQKECSQLRELVKTAVLKLNNNDCEHIMDRLAQLSASQSH